MQASHAFALFLQPPKTPHTQPFASKPLNKTIASHTWQAMQFYLNSLYAHQTQRLANVIVSTQTLAVYALLASAQSQRKPRRSVFLVDDLIQHHLKFII